ncbi:hypothetical protein MIV029R [Invertebrate iridescent virus 3]|uniref:Putative kinase protein 029R n=1 Tax=Invertebrate iridescent virus 3 TaxID=345201 RepID=VF143_IIV3|nr:hypothetical protein MIV029R [Invertebrate iridescent virus 3]Q197D1.1 RecName: Full=Putative kinase protein 029R [Invertebrate iridescent virus 3]ABF82059.1 hypothetical protein MIV029R [Invertebrate iridescent virus 3]
MVYVISIEGIIGSGKSSLMDQLKRHYTCHQEPLHDWSLLQPFYDDMERYASPFQFQVLFSFHKLYSTIKNVNDVVILERCPWSSRNIFTKMLVQDGFISPQEYELYMSFYDRLAFTTNLHIYLKVDPTVAFDRILKRNREAEKTLQYDYLVRLNHQYEAEISKCDNVYVVDANKPMELVGNTVLRLLSRLCRR